MTNSSPFTEERTPLLSEDEAKERIATFEREARAKGDDPACALLFHEIGRLWERPLKNPRSAAVAYQQAFRLAPRFLANLRSARRLFSEAGNWLMVLDLLAAELAAVEDVRLKAALLIERGDILERRLSREGEAREAYQQALALAGSDLVLLTRLETVFAGKSDLASLAKVYLAAAELLDAPALKVRYLLAAGTLFEGKLGLPDEAARCYRQAFALDRQDPLLLEAMKRLTLSAAAQKAPGYGDSDVTQARQEELLSVLMAEADLLGEGAVPVYLQISKLLERMGRHDDSVGALRAARRLAPDEELVLAELAQVYETRSKYEDLADVLLAWSEATKTDDEFVTLNLRLAAVYEENLLRDADAIARYRAIIARVPSHAAALAGLGKLCYRAKDWEGLIAAYDGELAASPDPRVKATRMYKAAEVLEERLQRLDEAIGRYNQSLKYAPGYLPAVRALTRLYERLGRFQDLVDMFEQELLQTHDWEQQASLLFKMAETYEGRLSAPEQAIVCMRRVLDASPNHLVALRNLARLQEKCGHWKELLDTHDVEASLVGDTKQVLSIRHRNAEILEVELKDRDGAIAAYERLLTLSPSYVPALKALGRLYAQAERWSDLIRMYRAESEISSQPEQAATLVHRVGELYERRLGDVDQAIASYQEALTLSPTSFASARALERIYREQGAWESLIDVLRSEAANRNDAGERANVLYQAAAIWEEHLGRSDLAIAGYREVLQLVPEHLPALRALETLWSSPSSFDPKELVWVLEQATRVGSVAARAGAFVKLGRLYADRLGDVAKGEQSLRAALELEPSNLTALKLLERMTSMDPARRLERAGVVEQLAAVVGDARLGAALALSAQADRTPSTPQRADSESPARLNALRLAWQADPASPHLSLELEQGCSTTGRTAELVSLLEKRLEATSLDQADRVETLLRLGELYEGQEHTLAKAISAYEEALELVAGLVPALQGARRAHLRLGDFPKAIGLLETEGATSRESTSAVQAFNLAGKLSDEVLGDRERAITNYQRALERNPLDAQANQALPKLLTNQSDAADLSAFHERRADALLLARDASGAADELTRAARVQVEVLHNPARALELLERALGALPTHPAALELKGDLAAAAASYAEAVSAYAVRAHQGGEPRSLAQVHVKMAALFHEQLSDLTRAIAHLETALGLVPDHLEALDRLAAIHTATQNWTSAADCLRRLLDAEGTAPARPRHLQALGHVTEAGLSDAAGASALYLQAVRLVPQEAEPLEALVRLHQRLGTESALLESLEEVAAGVEQPAAVIALRLRLAELNERPSGAPARAIESYRRILALDATNETARFGLAKLLAKESSTAPQAVEELRTILRASPMHTESLRALFRLWESQGETDRAFCVASLMHLLYCSDDVEEAFLEETRSKLPHPSNRKLAPAEIDGFMPPSARGPLLEVLRVVGDQLSKLYPAPFEQLGIDRKADRLKSDHIVYRAVKGVADLFGIEELEVYQARRGMVGLLNTEPLGVYVGQEVVRKFNVREQRYLLGKAAFGLYNRAAVLRMMPPSGLAELLESAIRIFQPEVSRLAKRNDELVRQLRKACSRKALKALEPIALRAAQALQPPAGGELPSVERLVEGFTVSEHRAGMLVAVDVAAALSMQLREDPSYQSSSTIAGAHPIHQALSRRPDIRELMGYALSDEFAALRKRAGLALDGAPRTKPLGTVATSSAASGPSAPGG